MMRIDAAGTRSGYEPPARRSAAHFYDRQIRSLQDKIKELKGNKGMDSRQKNDMIAQYQKQIEDLNSQKAQMLLQEQAQPARNSSGPKVNNPPVEEEEIVDKGVQRALIQSGSSKEQSRALGQVRAQAKGELRKAESTAFSVSKPEGNQPGAGAAIRQKLAAIDSFEIRQSNKIARDMRENGSEKTERSEGAVDTASEEVGRTGTGRMEPGQFLDDEA